MNPEMRYFRGNALVKNNAVAVSSTATKALPYNPMRYAITVWNDGTIDLTLTFGDAPLANTGTMHIPAGLGPVVITEDTVGELVRMPMWAVSATAGPTTVNFTTLSYDPFRYEEMIQYVNKCLAWAGPLRNAPPR